MTALFQPRCRARSANVRASPMVLSGLAWKQMTERPLPRSLAIFFGSGGTTEMIALSG